MRTAILLITLLVCSSSATAQDYNSSLWLDRSLLKDSILSAPGLVVGKKRDVELWLARMPPISAAQSRCEEHLPGGWQAFVEDAKILIPLIEQRRDKFQLRKIAQPLIETLRGTKICAIGAAAKEVADAIKMSAIFAGGN